MQINTDRLQQLLGSEEAARRFVKMFEENLPMQVAALREALSSGNWETASNTAHGLKSQCRYLGLDHWADALQKIENNPEQAQDTSFIAVD